MIAKSADSADAVATKVYMGERRKNIAAGEMKNAEIYGKAESRTAAMPAREAYASPRYREHLEALRQAVEERERLRWMLIAAQERIAVWRSQEASNRNIDRATL